MNRPFDVIVFGATGFTGWLVAGRSRDKLAEVRRLVGADESLPLIPALDAPARAGLRFAIEE